MDATAYLFPLSQNRNRQKTARVGEKFAVRLNVEREPGPSAKGLLECPPKVLVSGAVKARSDPVSARESPPFRWKSGARAGTVTLLMSIVGRAARSQRHTERMAEKAKCRRKVAILI